MDWQALQNGLKAVFAEASGLAAPTIAWDGEAQVHRAFPQADLQLLTQGRESGTDEVRVEVTDDGELLRYVVGHRTAQWLITLRSRDQRGPAKSFAVLDRVRTKLELPHVREAIEALDITVRDTGPIVDLGAVSDQRELSAASLTVNLAYTVLESEPAEHAIQPIEQVEVGGDVAPVGPIPDQTIP